MRSNVAYQRFRRLPRSAFEPLQLTAILQSPVISDDYLPIDGVLYYQAMRDVYGDQEITFSGSNHPNAVLGARLPIARCDEEGPSWYYAASFAQWGESARGMDHWNRRFDVSLVDLIDWQGRKARIDISASRYKSYHMPVYYRHAVSVKWFVLGNRALITRFLPHITHLGKKPAQGWGAVLRWEIAPTTEDWSVRGPDGRLMRAIPAADGVVTGFRPSYWMPKNQAVCALPSSLTPSAK